MVNTSLDFHHSIYIYICCAGFWLSQNAESTRLLSGPPFITSLISQSIASHSCNTGQSLQPSTLYTKWKICQKLEMLSTAQKKQHILLWSLKKLTRTMLNSNFTWWFSYCKTINDGRQSESPQSFQTREKYYKMHAPVLWDQQWLIQNFVRNIELGLVSFNSSTFCDEMISAKCTSWDLTNHIKERQIKYVVLLHISYKSTQIYFPKLLLTMTISLYLHF